MGNMRRVQAAARLLTLCAVVFTMSEQLHAACLSPPGDTNGDGAANVLDVQCNILMNLWSLNGQIGPVPQCMGTNPQPTLVPDHNCDNVINISDTVLSVTFALLAPLNGDIDGNVNQCVDTCESDLDGDGDFDFLDCAPLNGNVFKGAVELCNGYDDDCDGIADEPSAESVAESCNDNNACTGIESCTPVQIDSGISITELQIDPGPGLQPQGEWIEIFNGGAVAINVRGFKLKDNDGEFHTIDPGGALFIPPGGTLVFAAGSDMATNGGARVHYQYVGFNLDDTADEVVLLDAQNNELDRVEYDTSNGWAVVTGKSLAVVDHFGDNNQSTTWAPSTASYGSSGLKGTPSGPNYDVYPNYCAAGEPVDCSGVEDACNDSSCDVTDGSCSPVPINEGGDCDDGNLCTQTDTCSGGNCTGNNPVSCGSAALCYSTPTCNPDTGDCDTTPLANGTLCSDGLGCTASDACTDGTCLGTPVHAACDDGVFCTLDLCLPGSPDADNNGCVVDPTGKFGTECDDDNVCTYPDVCDFDGTCAPGFGVTCNDKNPCTDDFCDPSEGCQYVPNTSACNDGVTCTTGDVCASGACAGTPNHTVCDDGEFCTQNLCIPGSAEADPLGCVLDPLANFGTPCDDENECTYPDVCDFDGTCAPGFGVTCNDQNPCTDDICDETEGCVFAPNNDACDDGIECTQNDGCTAGICVGEATDEACEDGEFCTKNTCDAEHPDADGSGCVTDALAMFGTVCDDGSECTYPDVCDFDGTCAPGFGVTCNDQNPCTDDSCDPDQGCVYAPNSEPCDDNSLCTMDDQCAGGDCVGGEAPDCDDNNVCTDDGCDPDSGCTNDDNTELCDDGDECTLDDQCADGSCVGGQPPDCSDDNPCTDNSCDPDVGCVITANLDPCDDNNACTLNDQCDDGDCVGGEAPDCDDNNVCTDDGCDPDSGCTNDDNTELCDDGDECTLDDQCADGNCVGGQPPDCDDDNPCTDNSCDPDVGCVITANLDPCDDNNACTLNDQCDEGDCVGGEAPDCDDGNPCTDDGCDPDSGCTNDDNTELCDDGDECTLDDQCADGNCVGGQPPDCDDDNPCTDNSCEPDVGCVVTANLDPCDDNNACTLNDQCDEGDCVGGEAPDCEDGNPCTDDGCDPTDGCFVANNTDACDDGVGCTIDDVCSEGSCVGSVSDEFCDDGVFCTQNTCDSEHADADDQGCVTDGLAMFGVPCDDGSECTWPDVCDFDGNCEPGFGVTCNDLNPCTDDFCDDAQGCVFADNTEVCDDGVGCTADDVCTMGACIGTPSAEACEDGVFCTLNECDHEHPDADDQGCVTDGLAMFGVPCDDGSECTWPDVCDFDGNCEPGFGVTCNDLNPCTDDFCDDTEGCIFADNTEVCDDGVGCTTDDVCTSGTCTGTPSAEACEDGVFCTLNECNHDHPDADDQGCVTDGLAMFGVPCDDGSECTWPDVCDFDGNCEPGFGVTCNDLNPCTDDFCDDTEGCIFADNTEACDDGIGCTLDDVCLAGSCAGTATDGFCEDDNACTANTCDAQHPDADSEGCVVDPFAAFGQLCDDGDGCTFPDVCDFDGNCTPGFGIDCDDGASCTIDSCDSDTGECVYVATECADDGLACTVDYCDPTDANAEADGCVHDAFPLFGTLCDDGNECTWPDACDFDGACVPGFDVECDDGNPDTLDSCDPATGECIYTPMDCDDGDVCTDDDFDLDTMSCVYTEIECNDDEFCTEDSCDASHPLADASGCVFNPFAMFGTLCDDGNECTWPDVCDLNGTCASGFDIECDDGDICTLDFCDPAAGCFNEPSSEPCDDGITCTINDLCSNGACQGAPFDAACDDDNVCSIDICDPASGDADANGCIYDTLSAFASPCDDGNACTEPDLCDFFGGCEPGFEVICDDGDVCTNDYCDSDLGCVSSGTVLAEDFETGAPGWTTGVLSGAVDGWTLTDMSGGSQPVNFGSVAFGTPNDGDLYGYENSYLQSPVFNSSGGATLTFDSYSSNEQNNPFDAESVQISYDGGNSWEILIPSTHLYWTDFSFHQVWVTFVVDIPAASGTSQTVLRFVYDTVDGCCGYTTITGWFVDNLVVTGTAAVDCNDYDACTIDACDPTTGCYHTDVNCDDDDVCTLDECVSDSGTCLYSLVSCDDNDGCTVDLCEPGQGCIYENVDCDDFDVCTLDECLKDTGECLYSSVSCDDEEFCTLDYCDPFDIFAGPDGCVHDGLSMFAQPCDDGNPCTEPDLCDFFGLCEPGFGVLCNDNNPCTLDACNPDTGECEFVAASGSCSDGVACTTGDTCVAGSCVGTPSHAACEDGNACTTNLCNPPTGCVIAPTSTWYVDAAKAGLPQNGTSWATAYATVQAAVDAAQTGDVVWVRTGTYKPAAATANVVVMKACVDLYGGFAGNENTLAARPMLLTTLSGDFDNSNSASAADSIHVVTAASNSRLDGFTITRGNSTGQGGCIYGINTMAFTVDNCTVTQCVAAFSGGGAYLTGSPITIEDSLFSLNTAGPGNSADGGGLFISSGNLNLLRSTFVQNVANHQGGAGYLSTSNSVIRDCDFEGNLVQQGGGQVAGGGALWANNGTTSIYNTEFVANQCAAGSGGWGGAVLFFGGIPTVVNCTFAENTAPGPGHAIALFSGSAPVISNSILWSAVAGAQLGNGGGASPVIQFSCLSGGWTGAGSGNADLNIPADNPFTLGPQNQHYLKHLNVGGAPFTSACVNLGNNTIATNAGIPWQSMTTRLDLVNDATPVDAGRHY